jgi:hypothetical protein|tara:strand:+ start:516 stop:1061 length:546 start_codon:yes stop_codon:yes gene_type:complete
MQHEEQSPYYGVMAQFDNPDDLLAAAKATFAAGYRKLDAFSPLPVHGLAHAIGYKRTRLPWLVFCMGIVGAIAGYGLCYWVSVIDYPLNIGGRPFHSGLSFIPVTFELTILFSALTSAFGMLIANGLPQPYHPVFNVENFARASSDLFFLCIEAEDEKFDMDETTLFLQSLNPQEVSQVEN